MIILKEVNETTEGTWFDFTLRGQKVEFKIRPYSNEVYENIRRKYKKTTKQVDPHSRAMVNMEVYDEDAITDEFIDYLLEDFKGFGTDGNEPLKSTLKNKKRIVNIPTVKDSETSISDFIFLKARELSASVEEDNEQIEKN